MLWEEEAEQKMLQLVPLGSKSSARRQVSLCFVFCFFHLEHVDSLLLLPLYTPSNFQDAGTFPQLIIALIRHTFVIFAFLEASTRFTFFFHLYGATVVVFYCVPPTISVDSIKALFMCLSSDMQIYL